MQERWLSVEDVCEYLGVARDTVYKLIARKNLPAYRIGRLWKFKVHEVDEWVKNRGDEAQSRSH